MSESDAPQAVHDAVQLLQLVMDNIPQFIFWKDRESVYLGCNQNFATAAGVASPDEIAGKTDHDLAWKEDEAEFFRSVDRRVMEADAPEFGIVEPQLQADGREAWLRTNKIPLHDESGSVVGILGTFEDITAQREAEEQGRQRQKMESVGQLAGGIAHDFNNMLAAVINAAELMRRSPEDRELSQEMVEVILKTSERASELTRKLLSFSRQGRMDLRPIDIHASILDAVGILERSVDRRIQIEVGLDTVAAVVDGDPSELTSMLLNLGINARDAIEGAGTITISTRVQSLNEEQCVASSFELEPGPHVEITFADDGEGIEDGSLDRVFEPFFTTKSIGSGTGLGLAAVYGTVKEHEGAISVESRRGEGTSFRILLPLSSREAETLGAIPRELPGGTGTLLIIDDEPAVRRTTKAILEKLGYTVLSAADGREALAIYGDRNESIDGVVLDMVMPEMGGRECLAGLRQIDPDVRVLISSGYARDEGDIDAPPAPFLKKPYRLEELAEAIARLLDEG